MLGRLICYLLGHTFDCEALADDPRAPAACTRCGYKYPRRVRIMFPSEPSDPLAEADTVDETTRKRRR